MPVNAFCFGFVADYYTLMADETSIVQYKGKRGKI